MDTPIDRLIEFALNLRAEGQKLAQLPMMRSREAGAALESYWAGYDAAMSQMVEKLNEETLAEQYIKRFYAKNSTIPVPEEAPSPPPVEVTPESLLKRLPSDQAIARVYNGDGMNWLLLRYSQGHDKWQLVSAHKDVEDLLQAAEPRGFH